MPIERIMDRYDVLKRLGSGGMGDVWKAHDDLLGRNVAIKFVGEKELRDTPGAQAILRDEARNAGRLLGYPEILAVLDLIEVDTDLHTGPAVVLEYVEGCNVGEWIEHHRKSLDTITQQQTGLYIALSIVSAVQSAHRLSILHRDVKPQNVLCSVEGRVKVADFGLSRVVEEITRTHTVWGRHTPLYAAPEQWMDEKPDEKSDIYQVAATLYHLLAGVPANEGASLIGLLRWHENSTPISIAEHVSDLDKKVVEVVDAGLSKDPDSRPDLWRMFDAISNALLNQRVSLRVSAHTLPEERVASIAKFLDYDEAAIAKEEGHVIAFPHPLEAIQEAIGATLMGATCNLDTTSKG